jgi:hypothetical protein
MKKYKIQVIRLKNELLLQVRSKGKIVCNLHLHAYNSYFTYTKNYIVMHYTDSAFEFFYSLSEKMREYIKYRILELSDTWNYGFTICTK